MSLDMVANDDGQADVLKDRRGVRSLDFGVKIEIINGYAIDVNEENWRGAGGRRSFNGPSFFVLVNWSRV